MIRIPAFALLVLLTTANALPGGVDSPLGDPNTVPFTATARIAAEQLLAQGLVGPSHRLTAIANRLARLVFPLDRDADGRPDPAPPGSARLESDVDGDNVDDLVVPIDLDGNGSLEFYVLLGPVRGLRGHVVAIGHDFDNIERLAEKVEDDVWDTTNRLLETIKEQDASFKNILR